MKTVFDLYQTTANNRARFLLGKRGRNTLMVVGLNPSVATAERSDLTASKVETIARSAGYDGFVIVNLYCQRSTDPNGLHKHCRHQYAEQNLSAIKQAIVRLNIDTLWAAWGTGIECRPYLRSSAAALHTVSRKSACRWVHYGALTTKGHPRHPSRVAYGLEFFGFDPGEYLLGV